MNYSNSQRAGVILNFTALIFGAYFKAVYTPADTVNYEVVDGVEIRVRVYADADAGESGSTDGKDYTADNGKNITPSTGVSEYMWLWLGILALSGGTSGLMAWKKRKQL